MKLLNYMEETANFELEKLLEGTKDICKCQKCKLDMLAWALNKLPPKYIVTDKGRVYTKLNEQTVQFQVDVIRELTKAILCISKKPQH